MKRLKISLAILAPVLLLVALLGPGSVFSDHLGSKVTTAYVVTAPPTLFGPPTPQDGLLLVSGTVPITTHGTLEGDAIVHFDCLFDPDRPDLPQQCTGKEERLPGTTLAGRPGTFWADLVWTARGHLALTDGTYKLVEGSGTGSLEHLTKFEGTFQRDETAGLWGTIRGVYEFELIVVPPSELGDFTVSELFVMEADGTITTEELIAELTLRAESK